MEEDSKSYKTRPKTQREIDVVKTMIELYCEKKHRSEENSLCDECQVLLDYSTRRLEHCRFQEEKPTCRKCEVHCYGPDMRERIKQVMRFSGPRMILRAPILWLRHKKHDME